MTNVQIVNRIKPLVGHWDFGILLLSPTLTIIGKQLDSCTLTERKISLAMGSWRNRQTRMLEGHVPVRACWFDSSRAHCNFRDSDKGKHRCSAK